MKNFTLCATVIVSSMLFSACDPQPPRKKPAPGGMREPAAVPPVETKPKQEKKEEINDPIANPVIETPKPETKPVPPPTANPEYGKKTDGKPGFIESPYATGKLIDVRGLPPGTEIECPYTRRALLVP